MAWREDPSKPILPTVNVDAGGGLLIDWLLANNAMAPHVIANSYKVHVPDPGGRRPSDHRLVSAVLELLARSAVPPCWTTGPAHRPCTDTSRRSHQP